MEGGEGPEIARRAGRGGRRGLTESERSGPIGPGERGEGYAQRAELQGLPAVRTESHDAGRAAVGL